MSGGGHRRALAARRGYALPAVLTIISILTLVFVAAIAGLQSLRTETRAALDAAEFERAAATAEARAAYILATEPLGQDSVRVGGVRTASGGPGAASGLPSISGFPLKLDNRVYAWSDPATGRRYAWQVQDGAGLMNLDSSRNDALMRLFQKAGTSQIAAQALTDQLLDYIDNDGKRRQYGAEATDYVAANRPPPPNAPLERLQEVFAVLDWPRVIDAGRWRRMSPWLSADSGSTAFNVNTAPVEALEIVLNLSEDRARQIISRREQTPITNLTQIGLPDGGGGGYTFPNGRFRFSFSDPSRSAAYRSQLQLTPADPDRPVWVTQADVNRLSPADAATLKGANALPLPDPLRRSAGA